MEKIFFEQTSWFSTSVPLDSTFLLNRCRCTPLSVECKLKILCHSKFNPWRQSLPFLVPQLKNNVFLYSTFYWFLFHGAVTFQWISCNFYMCLITLTRCYRDLGQRQCPKSLYTPHYLAYSFSILQTTLLIVFIRHIL